MIGIVIVAHARIASEMKNAVEHVLGEQGLLEALDVTDSNQAEVIKLQLQRLIRQCDTGAGVIIFADMFGGTPCNIALVEMKSGQNEVISGLNLPMLIKAVSKRQHIQDVHELAVVCQKAGRDYVCLASELDDRA